MNGNVWDLAPEANKGRRMLGRTVQEESLWTYLFTYSSVYNSISMEMLSDMFELDPLMVHSIISKMIINEELMVRARGGARAGGVIESSAWRRLIRPLLCLTLIRPP